MTLPERRRDLFETLQKLQETQSKYQSAVAQLMQSIHELTGAIRMLDQLIAEEGNGDASQEQGATAVHGNEIRAGEGRKANGPGHDEKPAP